MRLKRVCFCAVGVFFGAFLLPLGIWCYSENAEKLSAVAGVSAGLAMGRAVTTVNSENESQISIEKGKEISDKRVIDIDMAREETETPSKSSEISSPSPSDDILDAIPYPDNLNDNDGVIETFTYGYYDDEQYFDLDNGGQVRNCTSISNDELYSQSNKDISFTLDKNSDEPQILIYHTHATESFEKTSIDFYDNDFACKTTDRSLNIISVGDKICEELDKAGIVYIHDTLVHDYPSYDGSYASSRASVEKILKEYPSIKICLDIHRDGIERDDGTRIAPVTEIEGKTAAQIMIISCCDDGSGNIPNCMQNFTFASLLQSQLESDWDGLTRPVLFDYRYYNQDLSAGSLLVEVGSQANSIDEVQYSGELIGKSLVNLFQNNN